MPDSRIPVYGGGPNPETWFPYTGGRPPLFAGERIRVVYNNGVGSNEMNVFHVAWTAEGDWGVRSIGAYAKDTETIAKLATFSRCSDAPNPHVTDKSYPSLPWPDKAGYLERLASKPDAPKASLAELELTIQKQTELIKRLRDRLEREQATDDLDDMEFVLFGDETPSEVKPHEQTPGSFWYGVLGDTSYSPSVLKDVRYLSHEAVRKVLRDHEGTETADVVVGLIFAQHVASNRAAIFAEEWEKARDHAARPETPNGLEIDDGCLTYRSGNLSITCSVDEVIVYNSEKRIPARKVPLDRAFWQSASVYLEEN